jgi:hypothetical protein
MDRRGFLARLGAVTASIVATCSGGMVRLAEAAEATPESKTLPSAYGIEWTDAPPSEPWLNDGGMVLVKSEPLRRSGFSHRPWACPRYGTSCGGAWCPGEAEHVFPTKDEPLGRSPVHDIVEANERIDLDVYPPDARQTVAPGNYFGIDPQTLRQFYLRGQQR